MIAALIIVVVSAIGMFVNWSSCNEDVMWCFALALIVSFACLISTAAELDTGFYDTVKHDTITIQDTVVVSDNGGALSGYFKGQLDAINGTINIEECENGDFMWIKDPFATKKEPIIRPLKK